MPIYFNNQSPKKFLEIMRNFYSPSFIEKTNVFFGEKCFQSRSGKYFSTPGLTTNILFVEVTFIPLNINSVFLGMFRQQYLWTRIVPCFFGVCTVGTRSLFLPSVFPHHGFSLHHIIQPPLLSKEEITQTQNRSQGRINLQGGWNCPMPKKSSVKD